MDKHQNSGFTIVELLVVMLILLSLPVIFNFNFIKFSFDYFNPTHCQLKAMTNRKNCHYTKTLHFNENGNINRAQTIKVGKKECVFQLGMGRFYCE